MRTSSVITTLASGLVSAWREFADEPALVVRGETISYGELGERAMPVQTLASESSEPFVAVLAHRSAAAYTAIAGIVAAGKAYVPLNPRFPANRTARMLALSGCRELIVGHECIDALLELLPHVENPLTIACDRPLEIFDALRNQYKQHRLVYWAEIAPANFSVSQTPADPAYLLFTSGSTGQPKGVVVSQRNVCDYINYIRDKYELTPADRCSQMFELTFDLSVHDIFTTWMSGSSLHVVPAEIVMAPAKFVKEHELTMWFSVPSVGMFMSKMRMLKAGSFPSLRASLFCGEALPAAIAEQWQAAAPNSVVDNLYGPTEATIAICDYRWDAEKSPAACRHGLVPIGYPFSAQRVSIRDADGCQIAGEEIGELCLAGSQVTAGYLHDPERTAERFVEFGDEPGVTWYRTGDLVQFDEQGCLQFLGRTDSQVQIMGHRVELSEIDCAVRAGAATESAISVAWPIVQGRADGVYAFVVGTRDEAIEQQVVSHCRRHLPEYMVPRKVFFVEAFPLNSNGKIDRNRLTEFVEQEVHGRTRQTV